MKTFKRLTYRLERSLLLSNDPSFIVIGSQKSGTSSLHYYLDQHPEIKGSSPKEIHFFDRDIYFGKSIKKYKKHFKGSRRKYHFESSPSYLYIPDTAANLHTQYPDIKLVVTLRDPVKRAYSAWNHYRQLFESKKEAFKSRRRREGNLLYDALFEGRDVFPSFRECMEIELNLIQKDTGFEPALLRRGLYLQQLEEYWKFFAPEQMHIIGFKDLISDANNTLNQLCRFVGVNEIDWSKIDREPKNARDYVEPMNDDDQQFLKHFYAEPNRQLFERIGPVNW